MNKKVLIAEDEPYIVESLGFVLSHAGFTVHAVNDGREVIPAVREHQPTVVVLDLMLPHTNGFEILKMLKSDDVLNSIPILMLTAKGQEQDRATAESLGVDAFTTKSFSNREVVDCVSKLSNRIHES